MHGTVRIILTLAALAAGGCAGLSDPAPADIAGPAQAGAAGGAVAAPADAAEDKAPPRDLRWIIERLQDGQAAEGREALVAYLKREPGNPTARSLLQQLETDPVVLLGKAHTTYTLRPGDTLGELAGRFLGDPLRFLALARYNGIDRARSVAAGQTLKIPTARMAQTAAAEAAADDAPPASPRGRSEAESHQQRGIALMGRRQHEAAYEAFGRALELEPELEPARRHRAALRSVLVGEYHKAAVVRYRNQQLDEAVALWDKALALDPAFEPARGYRMRALELKRRLNALDTSS